MNQMTMFIIKKTSAREKYPNPIRQAEISPKTNPIMLATSAEIPALIAIEAREDNTGCVSGCSFLSSI